MIKAINNDSYYGERKKNELCAYNAGEEKHNTPYNTIYNMQTSRFEYNGWLVIITRSHALDSMIKPLVRLSQCLISTDGFYGFKCFHTTFPPDKYQNVCDYYHKTQFHIYSVNCCEVI